MDKCRSFDIWLDKRLCEMEAIGIDEAFYAGWQSRQAEVEEKDKRIAHLVKRLNELVGLTVDDLEETLRGEHES